MMNPFRQKALPLIVSLVLMLLPAASGLIIPVSIVSCSSSQEITDDPGTGTGPFQSTVHRNCPAFNISSFAEDGLGYVWMASSKGLTSFDGYDYIHYSSITGEVQASDVVADSRGNIWASFGDKLVRYDRPSQNLLTVADIAPGSNLFSLDDMVVSYSPSTFSLFSSISGELIRESDAGCVDMRLSSSGNPIATRGNNIITFDREFNVVGMESLSFTDEILSIICLQGKTFVGTSKGLWETDAEDFSSFRWRKDILPDHEIKDLFAVGDDFLLVYSRMPMQALGLNLSTGKISKTLFSLGYDKELTSLPVSASMVDSQDNVWLGMTGGAYFFIYPEHIISDYVARTSLATMGGEILSISPGAEGCALFSIRGHGLFSWDFEGQLSELSYDRTIPEVDLSGDVTSLYCENRPEVWCSIGGRLCRINVTGDKFSYIVPYDIVDVNYITGDGQGTVFVATDSSLAVLRNGVVEKIVKSPARVLSVAAKYGDDAFLAVENRGVMVYRVGSSDLSTCDMTSSDQDGITAKVSTLAISKDGYLFAGTEQGLLCRHPDGTIHHIDENEGLSSNSVRSLIVDKKGNCWVGTADGITRINPKEGIAYKYTNDDGLPITSLCPNSVFLSKNDILYFGGYGGLSIIETGMIRDRRVVPGVVIENLEAINGAPRKSFDSHGILSKAIIQNRQNSISISFSAMPFGVAEKSVYSYRLVGYSDSWNVVDGTTRRLTFTNLPAGKYRFEVKARSMSGHWSQSPSCVDITVRRPVFFSITAMCIYALLLILVAHMLWRYSRRKLEVAKELEFSHMRDIFYENISHELRTSLSLILSPARLLLKKNLPASSRSNCINVINSNVDSMLSVLDSVLDFKDESLLKSADNITLTNVQTLFSEIAYNFSIEALKNDVSVTMETEITKIVPLDSYKVSRILTNLVSNAIKHSPSGGEVVISSSLSEMDSHSWLIFSVSDSGDGMSDEGLAKIFDRYVHDDVNGEGHGIGLSFSKALAVAMGGDLEARRGNHSGLVFTCRIPLSKTEKGFIPSSICESISDSYLYSGETLLLVEDNEQFRDFVAIGLGSNYNVLTAGDGEKALEIIRSTDVDMVISDVMMAGMDGYTLLEKIRSDKSMNALPFILITGKSGQNSKTKGIKKGADAYLRKPFTIELLMATIDQIFTSRKLYKDKILSGISPKKNSLASDSHFVKKVYELMEVHYADKNFHLDQLCYDLAMSRSTFYRRARGLLPVKPNDFVKFFRLNKAAEMALGCDMSCSEIAEKTGFATQASFSKSFKQYFGVSVTDYVKINNHRDNQTV